MSLNSHTLVGAIKTKIPVQQGLGLARENQGMIFIYLQGSVKSAELFMILGLPPRLAAAVHNVVVLKP